MRETAISLRDCNQVANPLSPGPLSPVSLQGEITRLHAGTVTSAVSMLTETPTPPPGGEGSPVSALFSVYLGSVQGTLNPFEALQTANQ
jgi:hypothetical protein